ncbi:MAG: 3-dehydroquinate synthase [Candidatus Woesearchaeota archaeon]
MVESGKNHIRISLKREIDDSYDIFFGSYLMNQIANDLAMAPIASRYAIVTDSNVGPLYAHALETALRDVSISFTTFTFPAGEQNKNIETCMSVMSGMSSNGFGRDSAILALGGGVVGDMSGFMAAVFNRGIPYVQIPTTILAQADSSIGGKTAVDMEGYKNLIGAFKQPEKVYIDVATLESLSERDYCSGLAETVKHGIIQDAEFFKYLQANADKIIGKDKEYLLYISRRNCTIKGNVVEIDPHEKGLRRILNYGHTAGHAIETLSNFELTHGEAVAIGMMVAGRIANQLGYFHPADLDDQGRLLDAIGLPIVIPDTISNDDIIGVMGKDKKSKDGKARYVLPVKIGQMHEFDGIYATHVANEVVMEALQKTR